MSHGYGSIRAVYFLDVVRTSDCSPPALHYLATCFFVIYLAADAYVARNALVGSMWDILAGVSKTCHHTPDTFRA
jgi:hypothetical protein